MFFFNTTSKNFIQFKFLAVGLFTKLNLGYENLVWQLFVKKQNVQISESVGEVVKGPLQDRVESRVLTCSL